SKSERSLNEESGEEDDKKKRGTFFPWPRNKSANQSQKRKQYRDSEDFHDTNEPSFDRRESQGSMSSGASAKKPDTSTVSVPVPEKEKPLKFCSVSLPDGSTCAVPIKPGVSIRGMLSGLCEKLAINLAAVDLFLVGGDKPLVLDQDSSTLISRDLRLEKRTLFRLDLVPINRSVGLKAKPTKPVTEVLRPVVAKYGLSLNELVARINGEQEPLDLGVPISNLDGLRVVLDKQDQTKGKDNTNKHKGGSIKQAPVVASNRRNQKTMEEDKPMGKSSSVKTKGEDGKHTKDGKVKPVDRTSKRKPQKINLEEAEEFFEMLSKAQGNRAEDQRGLLKKEDLILPEFLRLKPSATDPTSSTPATHKGGNRKSTEMDGKNSSIGNSLKSTQQPGKLDYNENSSNKTRPPDPLENRYRCASVPLNSHKSDSCNVPFSAPLSPIPHVQDTSLPRWDRKSGDWQTETIQTVDDENVADLTLVAEGDIASPNSTLLPPSPTPPSSVSKLMEANFSPPTPLTSQE
uniref:RBD domain-containing protein n=1 Tax=Latimeria chalumnae TaxID=7897 RepID=H2ZT51_LATCH